MKRLISFLLIAALLLSAFPLALTASAEEEQPLTAAQLSVFDSFTMGYWPQSVVKDVDLLAALDSQPAELRSFGYTQGNATINTQVKTAKYTDFVDMRYADIEYMGARYRKVVCTDRRPSSTVRKGSALGYCATIYYKWDPIEWIVCQAGEDGVIATPHYILEEQPFTYAQEGTVWENSFLRNWLNEEFYNRALSAAERQKLTAVEKFGSTDFITIPSVSDLQEGGMLYGHYMNTGYSCDYSLMAGGITMDIGAAQRKLIWNTLSDDGKDIYYVSTTGTAYNATAPAYRLDVRGVKPLIKISGEQVLPGSEAIENYSIEHVHNFMRKIAMPELQKEKGNCSENAQYYLTCLTCDAHGTETFEQPGSMEQHTPAKVCSLEALDEYLDEASFYASFFYTCSACGTVIKQNSDGSKADTFTGNLEHEHNFVVTSTREADCTRPGITNYKCSYTGCNATKQEESEPALGHLPMREVSEDALCTEAHDGQPATYYYTCQRCLEVLITDEHGNPAPTFEFDEATHHHAYVLDKMQEPTCTESGYTQYRCSYCGDTFRTNLQPALGHAYRLSEQKEPACNVKGYQRFTCERCGDEYVETIDALEHDYSAKSDVFVEEPTCFENGYAAYACIYCGKVNTELTYEVEGSKLRHEYCKEISSNALCTPATATSPATYYYTCSLCWTVIKDLEGYETLTFTYGEPLHQHQYEVIETIEPDCLNAGLLVYKCVKCNDSYEEVYGAPLGHDFEVLSESPATCTSRANTRFRCTRCGKIKTEYYGDTPTGHQYTVHSDELYQEATCTQESLYYLTCSKCGATNKNYVYPKEGSALGHTPTKICSIATQRTPAAAGKPATYYYTCSVCNTILSGENEPYFTADVQSGALADYEQGYTFEMGIWPQSLVENAALIEELSDQEVEMHSYGFGFGESRKVGELTLDYDINYLKVAGYVDMHYGDILYHGEKYRKVVVNNARINYDSEQYENNCHTFDGTYYFKWEPLTWRVIEQGDGTTTVVSNLVLDYAYHVYENYNITNDSNGEVADWLNEYFSDLALCTVEKEAIASGESVTLCARDVFESNKALFAGNQGIYLAPVSNYALLLGSNPQFLSDNRSAATATWRIGSYVEPWQVKVIDDGSFQHAYKIEDQGVRVQLVLNSAYVPVGAQDVSRYASEHEHKYIRMMHIDEALVEEPTCLHPERYYYSCIGCGKVCNDRFEVMNESYIDHVRTKVISEQTLKTPATDSSDAEYYYTCSRCGTILNGKYDGTFKDAGSHTGEHNYVVDWSQTTATCTQAGVKVYKCTICGASYSEEITAPSHQYEYYGNVVLATQNCQNAGTYYKRYQCKVCGEFYTDESQIYYYPGGGNDSFHSFSVKLSEKAPTCTQKGERVYRCEYCDVTITQPLEALGHDYSGSEKNGITILRAASCGSNAVYNYSCVRCGEPGAESYEAEGTALEHDFSKQVMNEQTRRTDASSVEGESYYYTCIQCGEIDRRENHYFTPATHKKLIKNVISVGADIDYGMWPQSRVDDSSLLAQLEAQPITLHSYGYRYTPNFGLSYEAVNMSYGDVEFGGAKYRKVVIGSYRSLYLQEKPLASNSFQPLNGYMEGNSYWFKWEPIEWSVLRIENGEALLVANHLLDAQLYMDNYLAAEHATWADSAIRSRLNDTFYSQAFSQVQKQGIMQKNIKTLGNAAYGTDGGADTQDRVFIPEYADLANRSMNLYSTAVRISTASDYAVAQGIRAHSGNTADWMTRTPSLEQKGIVTVSEEGGVTDSFSSTTQLTGVKPMICLNIYADYRSPDFNGDGTIDIADLSAILAHVGKVAEGELAIYDLNENGMVDSLDISILLLAEHYGKLG